MGEAIVYLVWAKISRVPRVDQGIVCMHCYSERRILVSGPISISLFGDCLVVG